jgi:pimeloyl-[acyl-carrier protein] methyl ester esterase
MTLPLVLLHGWGVNAKVWNPILDELKNRHELVVLNLPGYGAASDYSADYSLHSVTDEVLSQAPEKANWVGWSLGATIAMSAAIAQPNRFEKLQLISPTACFTNRPDWDFGTDIEPFQNFANDFDQNYEKALGKFLLLQVLTKDRAKIGPARSMVRDLKNQLLDSPKPSDQTLRGGLEILHQSDLRTRIADLSIETQVIAGAEDHVVSFEASQLLFDQLPNGHSIHRFESGHLPFLQEPGKYIEVLNQFMQPNQ